MLNGLDFVPTLEDISITWGYILTVGVVLGWLARLVTTTKATRLNSTELKATQLRVEHLEYDLGTAHKDSLTGIPDRYVAMKALATAEAHHTHISIGMVDINNLKALNDDLGHDAGDELIIAIANRLVQLLPPLSGGLVARLHGDEFLIISKASATALADAYQHAFADSIGTASIGIAESENSEDIDSTMLHADIAMYYAKTQLNGEIAIYKPELEAAARFPSGDRRNGSRRMNERS